MTAFIRTETSSVKRLVGTKLQRKRFEPETMAFVEFYHYTSEDAADAIIESGVIKESSDGGPYAHLGTGVYGTKLPPSAGKKAIAKNNWTQGWRQREKRGRVDYYFKITIPKREVQEHKVGSRHIYLHPGVIVLNNYTWECYEV